MSGLFCYKCPNDMHRPLVVVPAGPQTHLTLGPCRSTATRKKYHHFSCSPHLPRSPISPAAMPSPEVSSTIAAPTRAPTRVEDPVLWPKAEAPPSIRPGSDRPLSCSAVSAAWEPSDSPDPTDLPFQKGKHGLKPPGATVAWG